MSAVNNSLLIPCFFVIFILQQTHSLDDSYLRYIKDGCFIKGEALSCVKYKAIKIAQKTIFGDILNKNETIKANQIISIVPLDEDTIAELGITKDVDTRKVSNEPRSFLSEWAELAKYFMKLVQDFFKAKGLKVNLPDGARTVEDDTDENSRGKRKKLAIVVPLLTLLATSTIKTKLLLIPVLLSVMLIKKLLLIAALLLPSVLSTLKACKHHHPTTHYSYFGSSDSNDYSADYGSNYAYSATGSYGKDWAANRAYNMGKHRITPAPAYITAPGAVA